MTTAPTRPREAPTNIQTFALLVDAYRELNAKKLFWITMMLSALVVASFGAVGINQNGLTVLWWDIPSGPFNSRIISQAFFYKAMFTNLGIAFWLSIIASVLALISTAGIIPEFISSGAIEMSLSKPIGRLRLFMTKYLLGLLFVGLQVGVFSAASFLVIGLRGHLWEPRIFLSIPIVLVFFSYLFCVCVLLGMVTRSTIASLIGTLLFWVFLFGLNTTDGVFVSLRERSVLRETELVKRIERMEVATTTRLIKEKTDDGELKEGDPRPTFPPAELDKANPQLAHKREQLVEERDSLKSWTKWSRTFYIVKTILPKTTETVDLLDRYLITDDELREFRDRNGTNERDFGDQDDIHINNREVQHQTELAFRSRGLGWVLGTSLAFEAVVLTISAWLFCRRDF